MSRFTMKDIFGAGQARKTKNINTRLLNGLLGSIESHNKAVEEEDMWRQYEQEGASKGLDAKLDQPAIAAGAQNQRLGVAGELKRSRCPKCTRPIEAAESGKSFCKHCDGGGRRSSHSYRSARDGRLQNEDRYRTVRLDSSRERDMKLRSKQEAARAEQAAARERRKILKAEQADPHRWGHELYQMQHPEELQSSEGEAETGNDGRKKSAKAKKSKRKRRYSDTSSNDSDTSSDDDRSSKTRKKKKSKKEKKSKKKKKKKKHKE